MNVYELEVQVPYESQDYHVTLINEQAVSESEFEKLVKDILNGRSLAEFGIIDEILNKLETYGFTKIKPITFVYIDGEWAED